MDQKVDDFSSIINKFIDRNRFVSLKSDLILLNKKIEEISRRIHGSPVKRKRSKSNLSRYQYSPQSSTNLVNYLELVNLVNKKQIELEKLVLQNSNNHVHIIPSQFSHLPYYFKIIDNAIGKGEFVMFSKPRVPDPEIIAEKKDVQVQTSFSNEKKEKTKKSPVIHLQIHESEINQKNREIERLKEELKSKESKLRHLLEEKKNQLSDSRNKTREFTKMKNDYGKITGGMEQMNYELKDQMKKIKQLIKENHMLKNLVKNREDSITDLQGKCSELIEANKMYNEEMSLIRVQETNILSQAKLLGDEIKRLKNVEERYVELKMNMDLRKNMAEEAIERVEKLQGYLEQARLRYSQKTKELDVLRIKEMEHEKEISVLKRRIQVLQFKLGETDKNASDMVESKIKGHMEKEEKLNNMLRKYRNRLKNMQSQFLDSLSTEDSKQ